MNEIPNRSLLTLLLVGLLPICAVAQSAHEGTRDFLVDDPMQDGWNTELLQAACSEQLKKLANSLADPIELSANNLQPLLAKDFTCEVLRPDDLQVVFRDKSVTVYRSDGGSSPARSAEGIEGLIQRLRRLIASDTVDSRVKFKIFRITDGTSEFTTRQFFSMYDQTPNGGRELNAIWDCSWQRGQLNQPPRLTRISLAEYEEIHVDSKAGTLFVDCTESVLGRNDAFDNQLAFGLDHWSNRILHVDTDGMQGLAVADVNGDGLEDVYVCQIAPMPNRLFVQNADGTATERSADFGVDWQEPTHSALFVDIDNDGDQDLFVSTTAALLLMENDKNATFKVRARFPAARDAYSLSAADYDQDGDLDLCVNVYLAKFQRRQILAAPIPFHDARNGGRNVLLRNDGGWKMTDVTTRVGLEEEATRRSFSSSWEDYDNDGDVDLYVANDYGRNNLFRNDGGRFTNVAAAAGVEDQSFGMSVDWADFNRDGWMDMYVSNMFSAAGNRIVFQQQFKADRDADVRRKFQYMARGNSLFQNNGDGTFSDVSAEASVMVGYWAWGSQFADLNNDGQQDILVANGYLTRSLPDDL